MGASGGRRRQEEKVRGESWEAFGDRHGDPGAALVMWLARRCTGLTLQQIGDGVGGRDYAAVGMAIRRFEQRAQKSTSLRRQWRSAADMLNVKMSPQ